MLDNLNAIFFYTSYQKDLKAEIYNITLNSLELPKHIITKKSFEVLFFLSLDKFDQR